MQEQGAFECIGGFFVPCLTVDPDGRPRKSDGVRYFSFRDVARQTGVDDAAIREAYSVFLREIGGGCAQIESQSSDARQALRLRFGCLSDQHFAEFLEICRAKRFNPWGKHVWPTMRPGAHGLPELIVNLTVDGFHAIALRTGELEKIVGPEWCGSDRAWVSVWTSSEPPAAARVGVMRRGMTEPVFMVARWESYAPYSLVGGKRRYDDFWNRMPDFMLAKCAACAAIRRAFAEFLDGVYSPEELAQGRDVVRLADVTGDDNAPQTSQQFQLKLIDLGLGKPAVRSAAVDKLRDELPMLYNSNLPAFYAAAVKRVKEDPGVYGVAALLVET